jgi:hypothetical protein
MRFDSENTALKTTHLVCGADTNAGLKKVSLLAVVTYQSRCWEKKNAHISESESDATGNTSSISKAFVPHRTFGIRQPGNGRLT